MVLTESINYHANHIGAIRNNKDRLINECNVGIVITRERYGEYQTIEISGYSKNIRDVKKKLNEIVEIAIYDYNQYRQRKKDRKRAFKHSFNTSEFGLTNISINPKQTKQNRNPFDALAVDEDLNQNDYDNEFPDLPNICTNKSISTNNILWGDMSDDD